MKLFKLFTLMAAGTMITACNHMVAIDEFTIFINT